MSPRFGVGLVEGADPRLGAAAAAEQAADGLDGRAADLVAVFASPEILVDAQAVLDEIGRRLSPRHLIGATTEAVIGGSREVEDGRAISVWAASLPDARLTAIQLTDEVLADAAAGGSPIAPEGTDAPAILLADPFTFPADGFLAGLGDGRPAPAIVGGFASGGMRAGEHTLLLDDRVLVEGAVYLAVEDAGLTPAVSQGCAPIGPEMVVTEADGARVEALASRPAAVKLEEVVNGLDERGRQLVASGLLAGLVVDENKPDYDRGDFLVRGIHGVDGQTGAIVVGERVRVGQTMRFHVRDAGSATDDLLDALDRARAAVPDVGGALVFTCNGRGRRMFGTPDHDASHIHAALGTAAVAGMFANGEIGPVGGRNFLHGFTATIALFPRS